MRFYGFFRNGILHKQLCFPGPEILTHPHPKWVWNHIQESRFLWPSKISVPRFRAKSCSTTIPQQTWVFRAFDLTHPVFEVGWKTGRPQPVPKPPPALALLESHPQTPSRDTQTSHLLIKISLWSIFHISNYQRISKRPLWMKNQDQYGSIWINNQAMETLRAAI